MGQGKKRKASILARSGGRCIYCGGQTAATTLDHMPPKSMFDGKLRPEGLEFPSCQPCNNGAGLTDAICAFIGRLYPDLETPEQHAEVKKYLSTISNNAPGLLESLLPSRALQKRRQRELGLTDADGGFLQIGGTTAEAHLEAFAVRLGLAMHFQETGEIVPETGKIIVRIYSNVDVLEGGLPSEIHEIFPEASTLSQGRWTVENQFQYGVQKTVGGKASMTYAAFRASFALLAFVFMGGETAEVPPGAKPFRPGEFTVGKTPSLRASAFWTSST